MSQQFYNTQKAAEVLGVKPADVNHLREQNKLHGYRDGADWKFKAEDVQNYLAEQIKSKHAPASGDEDEELVLGGTQSPASGGSDLELSDFALAGSDINLGSETTQQGSGSDLELDLTLDQDVTLEDSDIALASEEKAETGSDLDVSDSVLDSEDLVLGGSGAGSDVTIGGDSGISLVDPADSGLALDEPLELTGQEEESLELGEDDMLTLAEAEGSASGTEIQTDEEFLLTPLEEAGEEESGSQVIALDTEGDEAATMIGAPVEMAPMLDEATAPIGFEPIGAVAEAVAAPAVDIAEGPAIGPRTLPEAPYSGMVVWLGLFPCAMLLVLAGTMTFDLLRNMWTWNGAMTISGTLLDMLKGILF